MTQAQVIETAQEQITSKVHQMLSSDGLVEGIVRSVEGRLDAVGEQIKNKAALEIAKVKASSQLAASALTTAAVTQLATQADAMIEQMEEQLSELPEGSRAHKRLLKRIEQMERTTDQSLTLLESASSPAEGQDLYVRNGSKFARLEQ